MQTPWEILEIALVKLLLLTAADRQIDFIAWKKYYLSVHSQMLKLLFKPVPLLTPNNSLWEELFTYSFGLLF